MSLARRNVEIAREYLHPIEAGKSGEGMARFFDPGVVVEEFPNRLVPQGRRRGLAQLLEEAERGQSSAMAELWRRATTIVLIPGSKRQ
jgi:hypothetical protein